MKKPIRLAFLAGIVGVALAAVASTTTPAFAARNANAQIVINHAEMMNMLTQRMSKEVMLIAIGGSTDDRFAALAASRAEFDRLRRAVRDGDDGLGLAAMTGQQTLQALDEVDRQWAAFDAIVASVLDTRRVSPEEVDRIAALNMPLLDATEATMKQMMYEAVGGRTLVSVLDTALEETGHQRLRSQTLAKEFLLVAYGRNSARHRETLAAEIALFDRTLDGLVYGDPEMGLIPAMTPEIRTQMNRVRAIWDEYRARIQPGVGGSAIDDAAVDAVAQQSLDLLQELDATMALFESL